jgi:DNA-binding MarR family transcriptional regulator
VRATAVDQATIRGVVDRLKARSLVLLKRDPGDRRKVVIGLTKKGSAMLQQMYPKARAITEATLENLNPAERIALNFLLQKMMGDAGPDA